MLPSPVGCGLGPRGYSLSRPQCVHCCYGPVTRNLPWGGLVDRLRRFCFHILRYPNYGALTSTPAGLTPAEHASLNWTHIPACSFPAPGSCRKSGGVDIRGLGGPFSFDPRGSTACDMPVPSLCPGHALVPTFPSGRVPSLHTLRRCSAALFECFIGSMDPSELLVLSAAASSPRLPVAARVHL